jgi:hypothetical protein
MAFVLMGTAVMAVYGTVEEFDTLYGLHLGVPAAFIGLWGALRFAVVGIGAALASLLRRRLSLFRTGRLLAWMLGAGLALLLGTLSSLASFLTTGSSMGLGILLGLAADHWGLPALFRIGAALSMAAAVYAMSCARVAGRL